MAITENTKDYIKLMNLAEKVLELPDDVHPRMAELLQNLANAAPTMTRPQIAELMHTTRQVLAETDPKVEYINELLAEAGNFKSRLIQPMLRAWRTVDTDIIDVFIEERSKEPYLGSTELNRAWKKPLRWEPIVRSRLRGALDAVDLDTLIAALQETYNEVYVGGNSGMGKGEILYMLLCDGKKPKRGDLLVEGFGEIEIKASGGRMRGLSIPVGSNKVTFSAIERMIEKTYPEVEANRSKLPRNSAKGYSSYLSLSQANLNSKGYPVLNEILETDERRREFYTDLWSTYLSTHHENHADVPTEAMNELVESFATGNFEHGAVVLSAIQFHLYKSADGFDAMMLIDANTQSFLILMDLQDIIDIGSIRKTASTVLKIDPPSIAPGDEPGAAAGLSVLGRMQEAIHEKVKRRLQEAAPTKNLHMTHVDELPVLAGGDGAVIAVKALDKAFNKLREPSRVSVNTKFDGSPAVYIGWVKPNDIGAEGDEPIFVMALKSLFAKNPKIITKQEDIDTHYADKPDLANKLSTMWDVMEGNEQSIPDNEIWQGDLMFTEDSLQSIRIEGERYLTFHPNTILYAVRADSEDGKKIDRSKAGVVWHTRYTGSSLESMRSQHDIDNSDIPDIPQLWSVSPIVEHEGQPLIDSSKAQEYEDARSRAIVLVEKLRAVDDAYTTVAQTNKGLIPIQINAMANTWIREGKDLRDIDASKAADLFREYLKTKADKKIERLQSQGKKTRPAEREYERWMETLDVVQADVFDQAVQALFGLMKVLTEMKMIILDGFNSAASKGGDIQTFLVKQEGAGDIELEPTGAEGFVIEADGYALKVVNRTQFSKANFSDQYVKGWEK